MQVVNPLQQFLQKPWLYFIIITFGISLKFCKVNHRYFWYDEISTIGHTSGNQIFISPVNEIKNINFFKDQLRLKIQNQTIGSQLKGLYSSTNLNPLHYTFLMVWYRIAGDSNMSYRYFNILFFILTLPVLFLLAKALFKSNLAGWLTMSLYVFSPYFHFYTHEARYNIFLVFLISLFHYLFLQAISKNKLKWWTGYTVVGMLALYASVMSGIMLFGHLVYIVFFKREVRIIYIINLSVILLAYLPWIISMISNSAEISSSLEWHAYYGREQNFLKLLFAQFIGFAHIFVSLTDAWLYMRFIHDNVACDNYAQLFADIICILFIILSVIYTIRKVPSQVSFFLLVIVVPHILFYSISDLLRNAGGSYIWRYHALNYIGIILFVSCLLYKKIEMGRLIYSAIYICLIIIGFGSIVFISKDRCYQIPLDCEQNIKEAELFSSAERPLLISDYSMRLYTAEGGFFTILNRCSSENIDILRTSPEIKDVEDILEGKQYSEIYVTHASAELVENLKTQFGERMDSLEMDGVSAMWQINVN